MDDAVVYLVPVGSGRYELYSEPSDPPPSSGPPPPRGFWRRMTDTLHDRWKHAAHAAHAAHAPDDASRSPGRIARARDWMIRRVAESIIEQRTLWSLRGAASASLVYPADLSNASAAVVRERLLTRARAHHGWWLLVNLIAAAATAILALLPGPNLIGYYFAFRVVGHYLSWRGARDALVRTSWQGRAEPLLTELGHLTHLPREVRTERVALVADGLQLPRLAAFCDRVLYTRR